MNRLRVILVLLAVFFGVGAFVNPVMARRADTFLIAYDRWIIEDYRYQLPEIQQEDFDSRGVTDPELFSGTANVVGLSKGSNFDPIGAVFGVFNWISESVGSVFGAQTSDKYDANQ